jgi:hypothetical protein
MSDSPKDESLAGTPNDEGLSQPTKDESLPLPIMMESENLSNDPAIIENIDTPTSIQEPENMEVHHHPDLHHNPKKWKEYFLEFLMIFLAVTMGFIAENIREHFVSKKNEKELMVSLTRDLNNDIDGLTKSEVSVNRYINYADSIFILFKNADYKNVSSDIYYFGRQLGLRSLWRSNDGTIQQLTYSGGFRLIENKSVIDSVQEYITTLKVFSQILSLEDTEIIEYRKSLSKIFSGFVFNDMIDIKGERLASRLTYNPALESSAKADINDMADQISIVKGNRITQLGLMEELKTKARSLIKFINSKYDLE